MRPAAAHARQLPRLNHGRDGKVVHRSADDNLVGFEQLGDERVRGH